MHFIIIRQNYPEKKKYLCKGNWQSTANSNFRANQANKNPEIKGFAT